MNVRTPILDKAETDELGTSDQGLALRELNALAGNGTRFEFRWSDGIYGFKTWESARIIAYGHSFEDGVIAVRKWIEEGRAESDASGRLHEAEDSSPSVRLHRGV